MAMQVKLQPDGQWYAFSTVSDTFCAIDMTEEEALQLLIDRAVDRVKDDFERLKKTEKLDKKQYVYNIKRHIEMQCNCMDKKFNAIILETAKKYLTDAQIAKAQKGEE